jgi:hypothetical protein
MLDSNTSILALRQRYYGLYFQDELRVNRILTLHAGLRWEPSLPEHEAACVASTSHCLLLSLDKRPEPT